VRDGQHKPDYKPIIIQLKTQKIAPAVVLLSKNLKERLKNGARPSPGSVVAIAGSEKSLG
jgi:hypothetical protein